MRAGARGTAGGGLGGARGVRAGARGTAGGGLGRAREGSWTPASGHETMDAWMEGKGPDTRPLRVDAERNLRRLLDAAAEVFAEHGLAASVDEIARRAGVGKGTVFRRFPTKEHLIAAIVKERLEQARGLAEGLLDEPDAGAALHRFMEAGARLQAEDRGFFEAVAQAEVAEEQEVLEVKRRVMEATLALLKRAQEQGVVRSDVTAEDVFMLTCGSVQAAAAFHDEAPDLWRRYLDLSFDGLRAAAAHPLSHPAPEPRPSGSQQPGPAPG